MIDVDTPIDAATEAWTLSALMLGFNELALQADTIGQRALARMFRDDAQRRLVEGGHARVNITRPKEILVLREQPHLAFDERDVALMRACVADWDAKKRIKPSMLRSVDDEEYERLPPISDRSIQAALAEGAEARRAAEEGRS